MSELTTDTNLTNPISVYPSAGRVLPSLRHQTFSGLIWIVVQTLASKALTVATQTALAFFLAKSVFGEVALVYLAASFVAVLQNSGLREILVQRQLRFNHWVTPAFWMALVIGIAGCILTLGAAPIAALVFHDHGLILPIMVVAAAVPFDTIGMIPLARLQVGLRFKALAILGSISQLVTTALSIFLAWRGFGIYSFVIPR
ncbi:MAG TPA: oligosaccharide flippase family protein, partial [Tepidisphaeraceae bacterium]|nr:oligosaccharide flippase family protein [Tepidisphaeraceae bacterium]